METTTRESLIALVQTAFTAAYPGVPLVHDNVAFDRNSPPELWVEYQIEFHGSNQVGVSFAPKSRDYGFLYVSVWCKEGAGWRKASTMCDWFRTQIAYKSTGGVNLQAAEPVGGKGPTGWHLDEIKAYFYCDPQ